MGKREFGGFYKFFAALLWKTKIRRRETDANFKKGKKDLTRGRGGAYNRPNFIEENR